MHRLSVCKAMEEMLGSATATTTTTINSSNIGFQVLCFFPFFPYYSFSSCSCDCKCILGWCYCDMQLLKKQGWKEGTGLGISEQVLFLALSFSLFTAKKWN